MQYLGDFAEDASVYLMFTSHDIAGNPIAPSSDFEAADFQVYKDATETPLATNGVTINAQPYNSVTGLHHISIDTSAHADYSTGSDYIVVLNPDETVDGQNVLRVLGYFSIENRHGTTTADILAAGDVDGYSLEESLKVILAAAAGKSSGHPGTPIYRAADDSKDRITATTDANGNRLTITIDETG
jgi:hypothetical protein